MTVAPMRELTPWEQIGGAPTIKIVVERIYHLIKFDDEIYLRYFVGMDLTAIKAHMAALLTKLLGGPNIYRGRSLADAHAQLCIEDDHHDRVGDYVISALWSVHAGAKIINDVGKLLDSVRGDIVAPR